MHTLDMEKAEALSLQGLPSSLSHSGTQHGGPSEVRDEATGRPPVPLVAIGTETSVLRRVLRSRFQHCSQQPNWYQPVCHQIKRENAACVNRRLDPFPAAEAVTFSQQCPLPRRVVRFSYSACPVWATGALPSQCFLPWPHILFWLLTPHWAPEEPFPGPRHSVSCLSSSAVPCELQMP